MKRYIQFVPITARQKNTYIHTETEREREKARKRSGRIYTKMLSNNFWRIG